MTLKGEKLEVFKRKLEGGPTVGDHKPHWISADERAFSLSFKQQPVKEYDPLNYQNDDDSEFNRTH